MRLEKAWVQAPRRSPCQGVPRQSPIQGANDKADKVDVVADGCPPLLTARVAGPSTAVLSTSVRTCAGGLMGLP